MITKNTLELFRKRANEELAKIGKELGLDIQVGKINYTSNDFTAQVKANVQSVNDKSYEQAEFEKYCTLYGLEKDDYMKPYLVNGEEYRFCGFALNRPKYAIKMVKTSNGKVSCFVTGVIDNYKTKKLLQEKLAK